MIKNFVSPQNLYDGITTSNVTILKIESKRKWLESTMSEEQHIILEKGRNAEPCFLHNVTTWTEGSYLQIRKINVTKIQSC